MKKRTILTSAFVVLLLLVTISMAAASLYDEIKWIDSISGLKFVTGAEKDTLANRKYYVSGDNSTIMSKIKRGLKKRGWTITRNNTIETSGARVITMKGKKKSMKISVVMRKATTEGALDVVIRGIATSSSGTENTPVSTNSPVKSVGADLTINTGSNNAVYKCNNTEVTINGSNNNITLTGTVKEITFNGMNNNVTIKGKISKIHFNGINNNVYWSKKMNPTKPEVSDLPMSNSVKSIP